MEAAAGLTPAVGDACRACPSVDHLEHQIAFVRSVMMEKHPPREALVVEDEPLTRMVAADAISDVGVKVHEAGDAGEALRLLAEHPEVALLFTDIELPGGMNGLVLAEQVHSARPEVELIVTSGTSKIADRDLPDSGTFLSKPYRAERLQDIVKDKLESRKEDT